MIIIYNNAEYHFDLGETIHLYGRQAIKIKLQEHVEPDPDKCENFQPYWRNAEFYAPFAEVRKAGGYKKYLLGILEEREEVPRDKAGYKFLRSRF